jgi:dipeptidyl aminopeptidase/acylaminoacyl peptidase
MRRFFPLISICLVLVFSMIGCGGGQQEATEETTQEVVQQVVDIPEYTAEDFLDTTTFFGASFSPDNSKVLVSSNESGVYNAYAIPVEGGDPEPLTTSADNSIFSIGYFPGDERFLYTSDQGGNELNHIYVRDPDGTATDLTPGDGHKASFYGWAWDDETFYVGTNERDEKFFDVYEYTVDGYDRTMVFQNDMAYNFADITPDRRYMVFSKTITTTNSDIYLYDSKTKELTLITEHEGEIDHSPQTFSPDGRSLYFLTDRDSEFAYLARYDLESGAVDTVIETDWDIRYAYFSKHGKYMMVGINNDARTELRVYDAASMDMIDLPELPSAEISSVNVARDESRMTFYASSSRMPSDLFYYDLSGHDPVQLTSSLNPKMKPEHLVDGHVVRFKSFDGVEIPGILYKPHQAGPENNVPALVSVHGGPGGQARVGYNALVQYLVNHGYAVYAINNRGSSGYGKTFFRMDDRKHGEGDLDDCVSSKKMLIETGYVDPDRIGIIGGSYGGYMVLAALAFRPQEFDVGVDLFGVSNWLRTLQSIPPWWESFKKALEVEMGDFDDEEYLKEISPLFHAEKIVKPMIVLQGANDPRVLQVESDEIVEKVRANGVHVEYVIFEDEGHGFMKNENREEGYKAILVFLDKYLK